MTSSSSDMVLYFAGGHLVSLDISWNGIEEGAGLIATALQKGGGAPLRVLKMSGSRPSDEVRHHPCCFLPVRYWCPSVSDF